MKFGFRMPSWRRSLAASTKAALTREIRRAIIPDYGKRQGSFWVNPKKHTYNKLYNMTTVSAIDLVCGTNNKSTRTYSGSYGASRHYTNTNYAVKEPVFNVDFSILATLENETAISIKKDYNAIVTNNCHIDKEIQILIHKREQISKSINKINWIKWLFHKRLVKLNSEFDDTQGKITELANKKVTAKVDTSKLSRHPNFEQIKSCGSSLIIGGAFVSPKYERIPLIGVENHREWFYTVQICKGEVPLYFGKSDHYLNLCGGDFTLSFTPFGLVFIVEKAFYLLEYSQIDISYRNLQMREPDPKFSKPNHNIISYVWEHSTMSGAPDRRYKDNRKLPIVEYGNIHITIGDFVFDVLHPEKNICSQFVNAINAISSQIESKSPLKTLNRAQIKKIKSLYYQSKSLKCEEDIIATIEVLIKEIQTCNCAHTASITKQLTNKIQQRFSETKKVALKNIYSRCIQLISLVETDLSATEILQTFNESEVSNSSSVGDVVKEKYAESSPDLQEEVKKLFDERKRLLNLILSKGCNHITSENSISIDDKDIESKDAMKRIHQIEKEVCDLLRVQP